MRGIVAEINRKYAIVLAQDGSFRKIRTAARMTVGSEIDMDQPSKNINATRLMSKVSAVAAGALFILGIGYGAYSYTVPYSYVDVDINPSIELTVNIYDRIIHTEALNDDGKKILGNRDLENISLESGVSQILSTALEQGYLRASVEKKGGSTNVTTGDNTVNGTNTGSDESEPVIENAVLLTVASNNTNKSEALSRKLADLASKRLEKDSVSSEVLVGEASVAQRNDARLLGVTPGKLVLIEDALESGSELKLEDLKKASVKDLVQKAKDKKVEMEKQKAEKKLEEEKQKIEEMIASNGNNDSKDDNKSDTTIDNSGNPNLIEPWIEDIDRAILLERLSGQLEILERMSELNQQNNGTDTKDGNVEKGTDQRQGSGNQAAGNNTADSNGNGNSSKNSVNNSKNESKNSGNNQNKDTVSKSNYNRQDITEILEKQKKERQQLKDELLDQLFEKGTAVNGEPSENKQKGQESKENSQSGKGNKGSQGNQDSKNGKENRKK